MAEMGEEGTGAIWGQMGLRRKWTILDCPSAMARMARGKIGYRGRLKGTRWVGVARACVSGASVFPVGLRAKSK